MVPTDLLALGIPTYGKTVRAITAEKDGEVLAVAGVIHTVPFYAFVHMTDEMRRYPKTIMRVIRGFSDFLSKHYVAVYATASEEEANAPRVLERAGFKYLMTTTQGEVYKWHKPLSQ